MDERQEEMRGESARRVLNEDVYKEAYAVLERKIINEMAQQEIEPARAEYLRTLLVSMRKVRLYLEQLMTTGTMAAMEMERKRTLRDKLLRRA